jgi:beta-galactosidase/beta-glucuronidase
MALLTPWGEALDPTTVLQEYPRPQLVRDSYQNLNGTWQYAVTEQLEAPYDYPHSILVPFSPEAPLSGVNRALGAHEYGWYRLQVELNPQLREQTDRGDRLVVNFGAVDQTATIYINGRESATHVGGYLPFSVEVAASDIEQGQFVLEVRVQDATEGVPLTRGKQKTKRGGIWYTPQSGIWQTVWLEALPQHAVQRVDYVCDLDHGTITITAAGTDTGSPVQYAIALRGEQVAAGSSSLGEPITIAIPEAELWSPENPTLYDVDLRTETDQVSSYFAMRSFGVGPDASGTPRLLLNGQPYFHAGVLDQGYWPDGLYTAPSDDALVWDIATMKSMGFNMLRKHIKVEPMRFHHHCDRLGMLVWQDMVNGGGAYKPHVITLPVALPIHREDSSPRAHAAFGRADAEGRTQFERELQDMVEHLKAVPSIALWVPFNEGWGQFDAARIAALVRQLDPTRVIDHASGWHDQKVSDVRSLHVYFKKFRMPANDNTGRAVVLSEYGGYNYEVPGTRTTNRTFGYRTIRSPQALAVAFRGLHNKQIVPAISQGLSATVYTQLSDVEDELNGLVTYDRRHVKISPEEVAEVNAQIVSAL